jgi:hypothetical protein
MTKRYIEYLNSALYRNRQLWQPPWLRPSASSATSKSSRYVPTLWSEVQKLGLTNDIHLLIDYALGFECEAGWLQERFVSTVGGLC